MNFYKSVLVCFVVLGLIVAGCDRMPESAAPNGKKQSKPEVNRRAGPPGHASDNLYDEVVGAGESINTAVQNAEAGDKILVKGTHAEQVVINKDLTLVGEKGAEIVQPGTVEKYPLIESGVGWRPLIFAYGGAIQNDTVRGSGTIDVTVRGFTLDGESNPAPNLTGVLFRNVKSSGGITGVTVENMDVNGSGNTFGLITYGNSKVTFANNFIENIERGGIGANGDGGAHPSPNVTVRNNTIIGSDNPDNAPNLIQIGYGAEARISHNTLKTAHYPGAIWKASGILIFESDKIKIQGNTVEDTDRAIAVSTWGWFRKSADGNSIVRNKIRTSNGGIVVQSKSWGMSEVLTTMDSHANNNKIVRNTVKGTGSGIGIHVYTEDNSDTFDPAAENNKLIGNSISGFDDGIVDDGSGTETHANNHPFNP